MKNMVLETLSEAKERIALLHLDRVQNLSKPPKKIPKCRRKVFVGQPVQLSSYALPPLFPSPLLPHSPSLGPPQRSNMAEACAPATLGLCRASRALSWKL